MPRLKVFWGLVSVLVLTTCSAMAAVTRVEILSRAKLPVKTPGAIPYEVLKGRIYGEIDPKDRHNQIIQDLDLAPVNARGHAEYTETFTLMRPLDPARESHVLVYEVVNRGGSIVAHNYASGDTFLQSGWQGDRPFGSKSMYGTDGESIIVPVAHAADGSSITGRVLARYADVRAGTTSLPLADALGYVSSGTPPNPATVNTADAALTLRTYEDLRGVEAGVQTIRPSEWAWGDCRNQPFPGVPSDAFLCLKDGFRPDALYQLVYTAKDPLVPGTGLAAIRDTVSFFRFEKAAGGSANPAAGMLKSAVAVGASQSGNLIRTLINLGFNEDEHGRQVFDGILPIVAVRQVPLNLRFAVPGGASLLDEPGSDGTVWWQDWPDETRGLGTSGLLHRCTATHTCPKVIDVLGSSEFYSLRASPDFVGTAAMEDIPLPAGVRRFYIASTQHGGGSGGFKWEAKAPASGSANADRPIQTAACVMPQNPNPEHEIIGALLVALKQWVVAGTAPPDSRYPTLHAGDLQPEARVLAAFPVIPGVPSPMGVMNPTLVYDFGPRFKTNDMSGILDLKPPVILGVLPAALPAVDADGNEMGGVHTVLQQAALGTYTGWNVTASGFSKGHYCGLAGSYIPFARTRADREKSHDPRLSLEERYHDHAGYVAKVRAAADALLKERLLLPEDAKRIVSEAEASTILVHPQN